MHIGTTSFPFCPHKTQQRQTIDNLLYGFGVGSLTLQWYHVEVRLHGHTLWHSSQQSDGRSDVKGILLRQKDGLYMLVSLASSRWCGCPGEYLLVPYGFRFCMQLANIRQDTSAIWEKLIKPTN